MSRVFLHSKLNKCILNKDALLFAIKMISKGEKRQNHQLQLYFVPLIGRCVLDWWVGLDCVYFILCFWICFWRSCQHLSLHSGPPLSPVGVRRQVHTDNRSGSSSDTQLTQSDAVRTQIYSTAPPRGSAAPGLKLTHKNDWMAKNHVCILKLMSY